MRKLCSKGKACRGGGSDDALFAHEVGGATFQLSGTSTVMVERVEIPRAAAVEIDAPDRMAAMNDSSIFWIDASGVREERLEDLSFGPGTRLAFGKNGVLLLAARAQAPNESMLFYRSYGADRFELVRRDDLSFDQEAISPAGPRRAGDGFLVSATIFSGAGVLGFDGSAFCDFGLQAGFASNIAGVAMRPGREAGVAALYHAAVSDVPKLLWFEVQPP